MYSRVRSFSVNVPTTLFNLMYSEAYQCVQNILVKMGKINQRTKARKTFNLLIQRTGLLNKSIDNKTVRQRKFTLATKTLKYTLKAIIEEKNYSIFEITTKMSKFRL